jgi:hypothetical protein
MWLASVRRSKCYEKHPVPQFSLKTGTIFDGSRLGLDKWLAALRLRVNCKNGVSSCEIARDLGITQNPLGSWRIGGGSPFTTARSTS